jgi:leader peptidase (prepilin peptidase) / N-methyltransferase
MIHGLTTADCGLWTDNCGLSTVGCGPQLFASIGFFDNMFDPSVWSRVPFHFWSLAFFVFGCNIGSFLNVCIHRMPLGQSIASPPSHCPHCKYSIPWYLNIPLVTWLWLGGKCKNCGAPISGRYFLVEFLTGVIFLACWNLVGRQSAILALVYCLFLAGLIVATFIDFEHFIIPDEITIGGMFVGFAISILFPVVHENGSWLGEQLRDRFNFDVRNVRVLSGWESLLGIAIGAGLIYAIVRVGKLLFGRQKIEIGESEKIVFSETGIYLGDKEIPYEELFYRRSDMVTLQAQTLELADRCYRDVQVQLTPQKLRIGDEEFDPEQVPHMEAASREVVLPREAMGFGDVKFMGAIGAFLGWQSVVFSLMVSSVIGSVVGLLLILFGKREWSQRLPYGPYIALAAAIWIFGGKHLFELWSR